MKKFTEDNLKEVINKQFELNGHNIKYEDIKGKEGWYLEYSATEETEELYREYLKEYFKGFLPRRMIEKEVSNFILNYGLTVNYK